MSKQLPARIRCPNCDNQFEAVLYRSIWIEDRANRKLIYDDQINVVICPKCKVKTKLEFPFLCTNVKEHIAVWYEPYPDPEVDRDIKQYAKHFGPSSFYATAPRIRDWKAFKEKIIELEQRTEMKPAGKPSLEMRGKMRGFINHIKNKLAQKNADTDAIPSLFFMDGVAALEYACQFMKCPLHEGSFLPAIVLDSREMFGAATTIQTLKDGNQVAMLRVASDDGGFVVFATTAGPKGPKLQPGNFVGWKAAKHSAEVAASMGAKDPRSGWVGLIIGTLRPEHRNGQWVSEAKFAP